LTRALLSIEGVTYVQVWVPDQAESPEQQIPPGYICVAILGGDPDEIAAVMRLYVVPGISTYGNETVSATIDGYCRSMLILRPILVPVKLNVLVRAYRDNMGCPPPSILSIRDALAEGLKSLRNGDDVSYFKVRSIIESKFSNVEVVAFEGERDGIKSGYNTSVSIGFIELATVAVDDIVVEIAPPDPTIVENAFVALPTGGSA
jgi:hypothetical protein